LLAFERPQVRGKPALAVGLEARCAAGIVCFDASGYTVEFPHAEPEHLFGFLR
jgi:hypothetical protein